MMPGAGVVPPAAGDHASIASASIAVRLRAVPGDRDSTRRVRVTLTANSRRNAARGHHPTVCGGVAPVRRGCASATGRGTLARGGLRRMRARGGAAAQFPIFPSDSVVNFMDRARTTRTARCILIKFNILLVTMPCNRINHHVRARACPGLISPRRVMVARKRANGTDTRLSRYACPPCTCIRAPDHGNDTSLCVCICGLSRRSPSLCTCICGLSPVVTLSTSVTGVCRPSRKSLA